MVPCRKCRGTATLLCSACGGWSQDKAPEPFCSLNSYAAFLTWPCQQEMSRTAVPAPVGSGPASSEALGSAKPFMSYGRGVKGSDLHAGLSGCTTKTGKRLWRKKSSCAGSEGGHYPGSRAVIWR